MPRSKLLTVSRLIRARRARRNRQSRSLGQRFAKISLLTIAILSSTIAILAIGAPAIFSFVTQDLPSADSLANLLNPDTGSLLRATVVLDRNGELISSLAPAGFERRSYIQLEENPLLVTAFSQYLDRENMEPFNNSEILAQQLVEELLIHLEAEGLLKTLRGSLLRAQSVQRFSSEQLIEWVLNSIDFGDGIFGVGDAASYYLNKSLEQANLSELALLAVIADKRMGESAWEAEELRREKQVLLLDLLDRGLISEAQAQEAVSTEIELTAGAGSRIDAAPYFTKMILEEVYRQFDKENLWRGGFELVTTLDLSLQQSAFSLLEEGEAEIVVLDPNNGEILAMLGFARDANHQAASVLSPFVYLNAFANGFAPASLIWDIPASILPGFADYENEDGTFHGASNLREALAQNYLVASMNLLSRIGAQRSWEIAKEAGLDSLNAANSEDSYELLLGSVELKLLEIARAYGTVANQGHIAGQDRNGDIEAGTLLIVRDPLGNILLDQNQSQSRSIVSAELAFLVTDVLSDGSVVLENAKAPILANLDRPAAIHMAPSPNGEGIWVVGYSAQQVVAMWTSTKDFSTTQAGRLWKDVFEVSHKDLPIQSWTVPANLSTVVVCVPSGMLPSAECPLTRREFFLPGQEPSQIDTLYLRMSINRFSGKLATVFTQVDFIDEKVFINLPAGSAEWAVRAGIDIAPSDYDVIPQRKQSSESVSVLTPERFSSLGGQIRIVGSADVDDAESYRILAGEGLFPAQWFEIAQGELGEGGSIRALWNSGPLDGLYAIQLQVISSDDIVQSDFTVVTIDNQFPELGIISPIGSQEIRAVDIDELRFIAEAADNLSIKEVIFTLDDISIGAIDEAPFELVWPIILGDHQLRVTAIDQAGNQTIEVVNFEVLP